MQTSDQNPDPEDDARVQLDSDGFLRHLLTLKGLDKDLLIDLLEHADEEAEDGAHLSSDAGDEG